MTSPKVAVLMPAYNAERFIGEAIDSVLGQTFSDFELIVVDDGSSDSTADIVEQYAALDSRVVLLRSPQNGGIAVALNQGLEIANGEYVVRIDSDDWSYPYRLERQVRFMDEHPEVVVSGGAIEVCDSALNPVNVRMYHQTDEEIRERIFRYSPFAHPAIVYRTKIARMVGGYNPSLSDADDYDFYFRLGLHGKFANLPDVIHRLRTRRDSVSQAKGRLQERLTIYIRFKAAVEYGYPIPRVDAAYTVLQYASSYVIPQRAKFWLFAFLRGKRTRK